MIKSPRDLPLDLDDIDASWLSDILQFPGVTVETCRRTGGHRGTSMSACFVLTYSNKAGQTPPRLCLCEGRV